MPLVTWFEVPWFTSNWIFSPQIFLLLSFSTGTTGCKALHQQYMFFSVTFLENKIPDVVCQLKKKPRANYLSRCHRNRTISLADRDCRELSTSHWRTVTGIGSVVYFSDGGTSASAQTHHKKIPLTVRLCEKQKSNMSILVISHTNLYHRILVPVHDSSSLRSRVTHTLRFYTPHQLTTAHKGHFWCRREPQIVSSLRRVDQCPLTLWETLSTFMVAWYLDTENRAHDANGVQS